MSSVTGQAHGQRRFQSLGEVGRREHGDDALGALRAASRSMLFTRACAYGLRTTTIETVPGSAMLST